MSKSKLIAFATTAAAAVSLGGAANASAAYCNASSCSLSNGPTAGGIYFEMPRGTNISMRCWRDGAWWNGTNRWFYVDTVYGRNWVNANQVAAQSRVGAC